jgi:hypothetical protein
VLEREGYAVAVAATASDAGTMSVRVDDRGWRAAAGECETSGVDFASLAAFLRGRRQVA